MLYYMDDYTSSIKIDTFRGICLIKIVAHMHVSIAIFAEQCTHIVSADLEISCFVKHHSFTFHKSNRIQEYFNPTLDYFVSSKLKSL